MALKNVSRKLLWITIYVWTHLGSCSTGVSSAGLVRAFNNKWDNSEACFMQSPRGPQQDWAPDGHNSYCSSMPVYWLLPLPVSISPPAQLLPGITSQITCSPSRQPHTVLSEPRSPSLLPLGPHCSFAFFPPLLENIKKPLSFWPGEENLLISPPSAFVYAEPPS